MYDSHSSQKQLVKCTSVYDYVFSDNSSGGIVENDIVTINGNQSVPVRSIFGWIIWMKRVAYLINETYDWNLPWILYRNGFGSEIDNNYWFGLERVHLLTRFSHYKLRIEVKVRSTQEWRSVEYWSFGVGDEASAQYQLNVDGYVCTYVVLLIIEDL